MPNPDRRIVPYNRNRPGGNFALQNLPGLALNAARVGGQFMRPFLGIADRLYQQGRLGYEVVQQLRDGYRAVSRAYDQYKPVRDTMKKGSQAIKKSLVDAYKKRLMRRVTAPSLGFGSRRLNRFLILNRGRVNKRFRRYRRRW